MKRLKLQLTVLLATMSMMVACKSSDSNSGPTPNPPAVNQPDNNNNNNNSNDGGDDPIVPQDDGKKKIAITIDDLPFLGPESMSQEEETERFLRTLDTLAAHNIVADGFANGGTMDFFEMDFLQIFIDRGHRVNNHTFSHVDLHQVDVDTFKKDITDNEESIGQWMGAKRFFRYPFLDRGETAEKKQAIADFLKERNYTTAPVSIESSDFFFNDEYSKALAANDQAKAAQIVIDYVAHVRREAKIYEKYAQDKVGRQIKHILLVHMNTINSDHLDKILTMLKQEGWAFTTLEDSMSDPIYAQEDDYFGPGVTWLQRLFGDPAYSNQEIDRELGIEPSQEAPEESPPVETPLV